MKTQIFVKVLMVLPMVIFVDWVLMVVLGCATSIFGLGNSFYCGSYCCIGKGILLLSAVSFIIYLLFPEIKKYVNHKAHAQTH
ncbi:MAG: hypothetical protein WCI92_11125 [Bacteroidota bacterium]